VDHLRRGRAAALDAGDYLYACYCAMGEAVFAFQTGEPLEDVAEVAGQAADLIERTGDVTNHDVVSSLRRTVDRLRMSSVSPEGPDDAGAERKIVESSNPFVISCHFQFVALEKYLDGDSAGASDGLARAKLGVPGNFNQPQSEFFRALLLAEQVRAGGESAQAALAQLESAEATLGGWAANSPGTFGYRHALVAAELGACRGDDGHGLTLYESAIKLAQDAGQILYEALANELAGKYAERCGWVRIAGEHYYRNASVAYGHWGARRKARQLAARVPEPRHRVQALTLELPIAGWAGEPRTDNFDAIVLARATQALSSEMVLSKLMARLMAIAIEQAGAERGFLLLFRDGELWVEGAAGSNAETFTRFRLPPVGAAPAPAGGAHVSDPTTFPLPRTVIDFVLLAREKVVLTQTSTPNRFASDPYLVQQRPRSLLCLPMLRQGNFTGVLYLENRLTTDVFAAEQVELLEMLSTQAAISLENARLYEEMEERVQDRTRRLEESLRTIQENQARLIDAERRAAVAHLESELAIARRIQTSILPRQLSVSGMEIAAVMRTATEVGGDYYDILPCQDGGFWLGIGDVSGHGLDAGLVMLMVQSGLAALMRSDTKLDPASLLCMVNRAIYDNVHCRLQRDDYVTLSLFRFFPDGRFRVAGAHEDILIWRAQSGQCESIVTSGAWIGVLADIQAATRNQDGCLNEGDVMVLFTDGIIEARRPDNRQLGLDPLVEIMSQAHAEPAAEIGRRIIARAQAWSPEQQDDQTVVVLRRGARAGGADADPRPYPQSTTTR
jgi:serine phosphatase RsbU (regulator of sigma subunit)